MTLPESGEKPHVIPLVDLSLERKHLGTEIDSAVSSVLSSGKYILGPEVAELEQALAEYVSTPLKKINQDTKGRSYCIGVASGTDALVMALMALGIGPGDEAVTVGFSWISTAECIRLVGADVVFVDVEATTFCLDPSKLSNVVGPKTKAVIAVSLFGLVCDFENIRLEVSAAEEKWGNRIHVIEDAAQSFGGSRNGWRSCGSPFADVSITSFFPSKPLAGYGDGGAVFTRDEILAKKLRSIRVHGKNPDTGLHDCVGLNGRLDTLQAAIVLVKFRHFGDTVGKRLVVAKRYIDAFSEDGRIIVPKYEHVDGKETIHVYGVFTIRLQARDKVAAYLKDQGVSFALYYKRCINDQPVFQSKSSKNRDECLVARRLQQDVLSLPMHAYLPAHEQDKVIREVLNALNKFNVKERPPV